MSPGKTVLYRWAMVSAIAVVIFAGCAAPTARQVQAIDSSEDTVKFLFDERNEDGEWERGLLECELVDGDLENCRHVEVEYE